jgi:hypothetical protein
MLESPPSGPRLLCCCTIPPSVTASIGNGKHIHPTRLACVAHGSGLRGLRSRLILASDKPVYPSKVKLAPTLCAAWLKFCVSNEAPRPRVAPVPSLMLYARAAMPRSLILACNSVSTRVSIWAIPFALPWRKSSGRSCTSWQPPSQHCFRPCCPRSPSHQLQPQC